MRPTLKILAKTSVLLMAVFSVVILLWTQFQGGEGSLGAILSTWTPAFLLLSATVLLVVALLSHFFLHRRPSSAGMA